VNNLDLTKFANNSVISSEIKICGINLSYVVYVICHLFRKVDVDVARLTFEIFYSCLYMYTSLRPNVICVADLC